MEEFEDVKKLSTSENGSLLLQLIKVPLTIIFLNLITVVGPLSLCGSL